MNILYISNDSSLYGANRSLIDMATQIKKQGHQVYVLAWKHSAFVNELRRCGLTPIILGYKCCSYSDEWNDRDSLSDICRKNIKAIMKAGEYIKKYNIQVIHTNASNVDIGAWLSIWLRIPHVWHIREIMYEDYKLKYYYPRIMKWLYRKAARMIFISKYIKQKRGYYSQNAMVLHNGINLKKYVDDSEKVISQQEMRLLYAGVIREEKGIMDAIRVVEYLVKGYGYNVKLKIAGKKSQYLSYVLNYIKQKQLNDHIEYVGNKDDLRELRKWADIALMCSRSEALGRVTIESMLARVLVVGARAGATAELIKEGKNGYLYEADNIKQMAEQIIKVYDNPEQSKEILQNAQRFAIRHFDNKIYANRMIELYESLIGENN